MKVSFMLASGGMDARANFSAMPKRTCAKNLLSFLAPQIRDRFHYYLC